MKKASDFTLRNPAVVFTAVTVAAALAWGAAVALQPNVKKR